MLIGINIFLPSNTFIWQIGGMMPDLKTDVIEVPGCECVSNAYVYGLRNSIRGAKFPMSVDVDSVTDELTKGIEALAKTRPGEGHDQWLTGVVVQMDLTFTNKAWVEAERYSNLKFISSNSTMHKMIKFDLDKSYNEYVDPRVIEIMKEKIRSFSDDFPNMSSSPDQIEEFRDRYLEILYTNPAGFKLTARMTTNYRQLKIIYNQRKDHRLPEWRQFCKWIESLPSSYLITGKEAES